MGWKIWRALLLGAAAITMPAHAQSVSGEIGIYSRYVDDNLFVSTDGPTVQAALTIDVSEPCALALWGSHGVATRVGGEIDVGLSCSVALDDETELAFAVTKDFLRGADDMVELAAEISAGRASLAIEQYLWGEVPDATRIVARYALTADDPVGLRLLTAYETGLGEADIILGGVTGEWALMERLVLTGTALVPIIQGRADPRTAEASFGLRFAF